MTFCVLANIKSTDYVAPLWKGPAWISSIDKQARNNNDCSEAGPKPVRVTLKTSKETRQKLRKDKLGKKEEISNIGLKNLC